MNRLTLTLLLLVCSGCGATAQRITVPYVRCQHVSEGARDAGGEQVYLAAIPQVVSSDGSGEAPVRRFPASGGYTFHSGNVVGRDFTDQSGGQQTPPVLWNGELKSGERLLVLVRLATPLPANAPLRSAPLLAALSETIGKESSLREDEKATLRHIGVVARDSDAFKQDQADTIGAFIVVVTAASMTHDANVRVIPVQSARDAQSGFIGGVRIECDGLRSRYQVGMALEKQK